MNKLLEAAKAVIARWDTPLWKDIPATAVYIGALREAIAALEAELAQVMEPVAAQIRVYDEKHQCMTDWREISVQHAQDKYREGVEVRLLYTAPPEPVNAWIAASKALPEIDTPVLVMRMHAEPAMYPMMRVDSGDGWLWAAHRSGPIDDPRSYEADDDYEVVAWVPLPKKPGATT